MTEILDLVEKLLLAAIQNDGCVSAEDVSGYPKLKKKARRGLRKIFRRVEAEELCVDDALETLLLLRYFRENTGL